MHKKIRHMYHCWVASPLGRELFPHWNIPKLYSAMLGEIIMQRQEKLPLTMYETFTIYIEVLQNKRLIKEIRDWSGYQIQGRDSVRW